MGNVGGEHDPTASGVDADELHPGRVAADRVQTYARSELDRTVIEPHAPGKIETHDADNIFHLEGTGEERMAHIATGRVVQLNFLQVKLRRREAVEGSDMVVVHWLRLCDYARPPRGALTQPKASSLSCTICARPRTTGAHRAPARWLVFAKPPY